MKKKETCGSSALEIDNFLMSEKAWPNVRNISTQHLTTLLHDVATSRPSARNISNATCGCWCVPGPWHATIGPSTHALVQQCCVNVAKQTQHRTTPKMLHKKIWPFSNLIHPTCCNISQQGGQTYATCCARQCCKMLRWNVASVWPGLMG